MKNLVQIFVFATISIFSFQSLDAQVLRVNPQNRSGEGGEIALLGSGGGQTWHIDNFRGDFRLHHSGGEFFKVKRSGLVYAKELKIQTWHWADYVFAKDYNLQPLEEVSDFIRTNKHLPNIPSAEVVEADGITVGKMTALQMEKIEELFLYTIELNEKVKTLEARIEELEND